MPSGHGCGRSGHSPAFISTPLLHRGRFTLLSDQKEVSSSSLGAPPLEGEDPSLRPLDKDLGAGLDADDEGNGEKDPGEGKDPNVDAAEIEILQGIINPASMNRHLLCLSLVRSKAPVTSKLPSVLICPLRTWMQRMPVLRRRCRHLSRWLHPTLASGLMRTSMWFTKSITRPT